MPLLSFPWDHNLLTLKRRFMLWNFLSTLDRLVEHWEYFLVFHSSRMAVPLLKNVSLNEHNKGKKFECSTLLNATNDILIPQPFESDMDIGHHF